MELGIDLGTGSVKAALYQRGERVREASAPYSVQAPRAGWAEIDPAAWWAATVQATREALGPHGAEVRALGLSGQMHGVVLSDARGEPLRPAILWADTRAAQDLGAYEALPPELRSSLRNPVTTGLAGPTLLWLRGHEPEAYRAARWALQPKDWLRLHLTGEAHAEPSNASATLLYDPERDDWHWSLLDRLGLRSDLLAPLVPTRSRAGGLRPGVARELGLPAGLPVAAGGADTAVALLGTGVPVGQVQLTVGTGAQLVVRGEALPEARRSLHVFREARDRGWYTLAAVQNAGIALEWARRALRCDWPEFYALAQAAEPGSRGLIFLPYLTGERTPHLNPHARGGWVGAGLEHDARHLARAAFEGVALAIADAAVGLPSTTRPEIRLAGGGSVHPWWRQLLADALARPLVTVDVANASVYGATLLAEAVADGRDLREPAWPPGERIEPRPDSLGDEVRERFRAAYETLRSWFMSGSIRDAGIGNTPDHPSRRRFPDRQ